MPQNSVVRVYATCQPPNYESPWQSNPPYEGTGSGVVIGPNQVLTGAHVVANSTFVQVQKALHPDKTVARVAHVSHDCDLALLEVEDPHFMDGISPAPIGDLPSRGERVSVFGFPVGGDELSLTEGGVSRIDVSRYSHSGRMLLAVTVDAAINEGNSGGPVFLEDEVAGIAFQVLEDAENIGELVPAPLVERFLRGIEQKRPMEVPGLGLDIQLLENVALRKSVGLGPDDTGVLVRNVDFGSSAWKVVQSGDAVLRIAGHDIANNGTIEYSGRFRTGLQALVGETYVGDEIELEILRGGERRVVSLELQPATSLVTLRRHDVRPTYFVFAGLVFQPLTLDYLDTWRDGWQSSPTELLYHYYSGVRSEEHSELVVLASVLNDAINIGHSSCCQQTVGTIDGTPVRDMRDFVAKIEAARGVVEVRTTAGSRLVIDVDQARSIGPEIVRRYDVPVDRSPDLS